MSRTLERKHIVLGFASPDPRAMKGLADHIKIATRKGENESSRMIYPPSWNSGAIFPDYSDEKIVADVLDAIAKKYRLEGQKAVLKLLVSAGAEGVPLTFSSENWEEILNPDVSEILNTRPLPTPPLLIESLPTE